MDRPVVMPWSYAFHNAAFVKDIVENGGTVILTTTGSKPIAKLTAVTDEDMADAVGVGSFSPLRPVRGRDDAPDAEVVRKAVLQGQLASDPLFRYGFDAKINAKEDNVDPKDKKTRQVVISMPEDLLDKIDTWAAACSISRAAAIRQLVTWQLAAQAEE